MARMILIFTARFNEVLLDFDFVLFKLAKRVPLESYPHIRPICLPRPGEDVKGKVVFFYHSCNPHFDDL